ncbi:glycosyltransferase [Patescibacteria group bacterium]|nr:glycosyltransferase [Patescibacteria group bacterium]
MKIMIVGDGVKIYSDAFYKAFLSLGHDVEHFVWTKYLHSSGRIKRISAKIQNKFLIGNRIRKLNDDLINNVCDFRPELVFIYRGQYIYPKTLQIIKQYGTVVFGYHNDDPFKVQSSFLQKDRFYLKGLKFYDWIFAYRHKNILDYHQLGMNNVSLLRSYYLAEDNYPIENLEDSVYSCDVIFIGHWEDDGRDEMLITLAQAGYSIKLYGTEWNKSKHYLQLSQYFGEIYPLRGNDYNLSLNSAKLALVFFSKMNNDTYTRRCFEIPATKTFMLSEFSEDMDLMFKEGIEAEYFRHIDELLKKIKLYLHDDDLRKMIAKKGYQRLLTDGHEAVDRAQEIINIYWQIK